MTPIQRNITDVDFRNVNDPHYWKAENNDKKNIYEFFSANTL